MKLIIVISMLAGALFAVDAAPEDLIEKKAKKPRKPQTTEISKINRAQAEEYAQAIFVEKNQLYWDDMECNHTVEVKGGCTAIGKTNNEDGLRNGFVTNIRVEKDALYAVFPAPDDRITIIKTQNEMPVKGSIDWQGRPDSGTSFGGQPFSILVTDNISAEQSPFGFVFSKEHYICKGPRKGLMVFGNRYALPTYREPTPNDRMRFKVFRVIVDKP